MEKEKKNIYRIDASGKALGRLASEIAVILIEKNKPSYLPYKKEGNLVIVENVDKMKITGKKLWKKIYYHHTGYPGHLKQKKMIEIFKENPAEILKRAIFGMLPKNKLRKQMIKQVKFE
ncbi:50S ribosomal protein L13 [bacterium]|nr:50S ribosomal protein L13 [bacterium]